MQFTDTRASRAYYEELSRHPLLSSTEERELLIRYNTCPNCQQRIPSKRRRDFCTECGKAPPGTEQSRLTTCAGCCCKFETYCTPAYCLQCGQGRDLDARERLVSGNLRFVVRMAKSITKDISRVQQLVSAGNVGLLLAIDKFDVDQETRFLTYAAHWIRKEMFDEIQNSGLVHVPSHKQKSHRREQRVGTFVCRHCDLRVSGEHDFRKLPVCSTAEDHEFLPLDDTHTLNATISLESSAAPTLADNAGIEEVVIDASVSVVLRRILKSLRLRERDKFILLQYYDIAEESRRNTTKSLHQLAVLADITPERVRQIKARSMRDVRVALRRKSVNGLEDMCNAS